MLNNPCFIYTESFKKLAPRRVARPTPHGQALDRWSSPDAWIVMGSLTSQLFRRVFQATHTMPRLGSSNFFWAHTPTVRATVPATSVPATSSRCHPEWCHPWGPARSARSVAVSTRPSTSWSSSATNPRAPRVNRSKSSGVGDPPRETVGSGAVEHESIDTEDEHGTWYGPGWKTTFRRPTRFSGSTWVSSRV